MKGILLITLAPLALAACKGSGDTITNNTAEAVIPDAVIVNGITYVREKPGGSAKPTLQPTFGPTPIPTDTPASIPTPSTLADPANLPPTQPSPGDGHGD